MREIYQIRGDVTTGATEDEFMSALDSLPVARLVRLSASGTFYGDPEDKHIVNGFLGVEVAHAGRSLGVVACVTPDYRLIQHKDAVKPLILPLFRAGGSYRLVTYFTPKRAFINVYETTKLADGVSIGLSIRSSVDGHSRLQYGIGMNALHTTLEVVGYRQICSNGMKIKVPLHNAEIIKLETVTRVKELLREQALITHVGDVESKIKLVAHVVETLTLLRDPVERMLKKAGLVELDAEQIELFIKEFATKRYAQKVKATLGAEAVGVTAYDLYNAITYVASHDEDISVTGSERLIDRAGDFLLKIVEEY